jgi:hypothetical protein
MSYYTIEIAYFINGFTSDNLIYDFVDKYNDIDWIQTYYYDNKCIDISFNKQNLIKVHMYIVHNFDILCKFINDIINNNIFFIHSINYYENDNNELIVYWSLHKLNNTKYLQKQYYEKIKMLTNSHLDLHNFLHTI